MTRFTPLWLQAGSYAGSVDRQLLAALWPAAAASGCTVSPVPGTVRVNVAPGTVAVPTPNNSGSTLCASDAVEEVELPDAPDAGSQRIDLVVCQPRGTDLDAGANNDFVFVPIVGAVATPGPAVPPPAPPGSVALAQIVRPGGSAEVLAANITDVRPGGLAITGAPRDTAHGWGYRNATFTVLSTTPIPLDTRGDDPTNMLNLASGLFVIPVDGFYLVTAKVALAPPVGVLTDVRVRVNGVDVIVGGLPPVTLSGILHVAAPYPRHFNRGDTIGLAAYCGGSATGSPGAGQTYLAVDYLAAGA
jgi:hypothetical protein